MACRTHNGVVVDTSVLIAILVEEQGWLSFSQAIKNSEERPRLSAANYLEARIVIDRRGRPEQALARFESLLLSLGLAIVPVDETQARVAAEAYAKYGKGHHPAALNFGDCFS